MKCRATLFVLMALSFLLGCKQNSNRTQPTHYKNLFTNEVYNQKEYEEFWISVVPDSLKGNPSITINRHLRKIERITKDSILQPFDYDIRLGAEYIVRATSFDKLGMIIPALQFDSLNGEVIQIGGEQDKPTLINLWFVGCRGCIKEMPELNLLKEKYSDKVNFVAVTFDDENRVKSFLKQKKFDYTHLVDAQDLIDDVGSKPYPENIFINQKGVIERIEGGIDGETGLLYFESILDEMLTE